MCHGSPVLRLGSLGIPSGYVNGVGCDTYSARPLRYTTLVEQVLFKAFVKTTKNIFNRP